MNKKILAMSLILILIICNPMMILAAESGKTDIVTDELSGSEGVTKEQDVTATFDEANIGITYMVTIEWGSLNYQPKEQLSGEWDDNGYYRITNENVEWEEASEGAGSVKITNDSNDRVFAKISGTVDTDFKNNYFITEEKKDAMALNFTESTSEEHTCSPEGGWLMVQDDVYIIMGNPAKGHTALCAITDIGITAPIEKTESLTNNNKKIGTITIELVGEAQSE